MMGNRPYMHALHQQHTWSGVRSGPPSVEAPTEGLLFSRGAHLVVGIVSSRSLDGSARHAGAF